MTTVDLPPIPARDNRAAQPFSPSSDPTVASLRTAILGTEPDMHQRVRAVIAELGDRPGTGSTYTAEARLAPNLLRATIAGLGGSATAIAADTRLRGIVCEWAAIYAPHLLPVLTGHLDLSIGAIKALGNGSAYQRDLLAELDTGQAIGVLLLTELGGTNGADQQTTATWDDIRGGFWLTSPDPASWKFMPNIADPTTPKIGVVTARLIIGGSDEGVLPLLLRLRTDQGLTPGLRVATLPDKGWAPMDHALIRFDKVFVPAEGLLGGTWAVMGTLEMASTVPVRARFHRAITTLGQGRLDLAGASAAGARAGLAVTVNYARQRRPGGRTLMAERGTVRRDLVSALAATYATSVLGRRVQDMAAAAPAADPLIGVWSMLIKPLLAYTAHEVLLTCRQRSGAQGSLRTNWIQDWIGNTEGIITAEGESQLLWKQAGQLTTCDITTLALPDTPSHLPWHSRMLIDRATTIAAGLRRDDITPAETALDRDTAAIELAAATSERLAATALWTAATTAADDTARGLLESATAVYTLERILHRGTWFAAHRRMTPRRAQRVHRELHRHRQYLGAHLCELVDGFGISLDVFAAPMAAPDYLHWWQHWATRPNPPTATATRSISDKTRP
ncbi:acyl-CoA dehydrogenase family protein [Nocardia ignorata]|uniref:Acyl-CoA oxidase n=1 Tax=Nocardia ignorata TaxID=145285 RepID=A0A4R6P1N5_NOCIG|nr:acyl-CoA dehydrogenase family protein [Nocardia ignorata]TDP31604.1 acyl-CoA oxidase [Nocardia ignorata]